MTNYNPFHEKPIDAAFKVKAPVEDAAFKEKKTGKQRVKGFFTGVGKGIKHGASAAKRQANLLGQKAKKVDAATQRVGANINVKRQKIQAARVQHLRRRQEISEYKTNILNLKHQKAIHKSNILSARVATVEQRRALREAKKNRRIGNASLPSGQINTGVLGNAPRTIKRGPLSDSGYKSKFGGVTGKRGPLSDRGFNKKRGPLSDSGFGKVNLNKPRKRGGFFS